MCEKRAKSILNTEMFIDLENLLETFLLLLQMLRNIYLTSTPMAMGRQL